jgi:hypothetical protein
MTVTTSKTNPSHLRHACIDIRQSTPGQVRFNYSNRVSGASTPITRNSDSHTLIMNG